MIKWQEVVTSRCKTNNTRPQTLFPFIKHVKVSPHTVETQCRGAGQKVKYCLIFGSATTPNIAMFIKIFSLLNILVQQPAHVWSCSPSQSSFVLRYRSKERNSLPDVRYSQLLLWKVRRSLENLFRAGSWHCLTVRAIESGDMECAANTLSGHRQSKGYYWFGF